MAVVYKGVAPQYAEAKKEVVKSWKERANKWLFDEQKRGFEHFQFHEDRYATLRDRLIAAFETGKQAAMEKPNADEKAIQAEYVRNVDEAWASYEKKRDVAYAIYRSRIDRAAKKHKEVMDAVTRY